MVRKVLKDALPQLFVVISAIISSFPDGMQLGWSGPVFPLLRSENSHIKITPNDETWLEANYILVGLLMLPVTTYSVNKIGRKKSILLASFIQLVSWIIIAVATRVEYLYVARSLSGATDGMWYVGIPMYISEVASKNIRGFLTGLNYLFILTGMLIIYSTVPSLPFYGPSIVAAVLLCLQLVTFSFMPESPYFLLSKNNHDEALRALTRLRPTGSNVEEELSKIAEAVELDKKNKGQIRDMFLVVQNRRATIIVTVLVTCQQFTGFYAIIMNIHTILEDAKIANLDLGNTCVLFGVLMVIAAGVCCLTVDSFGKVFLLAISGVFTGTCLLAVAVYFHLMHVGVNVEQVKWIPVASLMCYAITYKLGLGFLPQILVSELFSNRVKGMGMALGDALLLVFGSLSTMLYHYLRGTVGYQGPFYIFAVTSFVTVIYVVCFVPETKGKTLEEIQILLGASASSPPNRVSSVKNVIYKQHSNYTLNK